MNNPLSEPGRIAELVAQGYLVRAGAPPFDGEYGIEKQNALLRPAV